MKRLFFGFTIAVLAAGGQTLLGQKGANPFIDHSDTGETVHVLPAPAALHSPHATQPTDAPVQNGMAVYPASYGSGQLLYHNGGHQIPAASFFAVYWNSTVANAKLTSTGSTLQSTIASFVSNFSGSNDYSVIQQYSQLDTIQPTLLWAGDKVDTQSTQPSISDSKVQSYVASLFTRGVKPDPTTLYAVYFPSGMRINLQGGVSCSAFCGYHGHFSYYGTDIKYAVFPYTDCRACSMSGKTVFDILTIVSSHEIREAVTDPDLNAWFDSAGYEADDKCAWHNLYRTTQGGFYVQPEYSNKDSGCVVP